MKKALLMHDGKNTISKAASEMGRRGGLARAKALTEKERKEIATHAVRCRWKKHRQQIRKKKS
jgi:hypothetical protein